MTEVLVHKMQYFGGRAESDLNLVKYEDKYYDQYRKVSCDCFRSLSLATNMDPDRFYTREDLMEMKDSVLILLIKDEVVGAVETGDGSIEHLFVKTTHQNKGYGKKLLDYGIKRLQQESDKPVTLYVDDLNKSAIRLYENNGFKIVESVIDNWG